MVLTQAGLLQGIRIQSRTLRVAVGDLISESRLLRPQHRYRIDVDRANHRRQRG